MRALFLTTTAALPISDLVIRGDVTRPPPRPGQCRLADIDGKSRTRLSKIGMPDAQTKRDWSDLSFTEPLRDSHERGQRFIPAVTGFLYQAAASCFNLGCSSGHIYPSHLAKS